MINYSTPNAGTSIARHLRPQLGVIDVVAALGPGMTARMQAAVERSMRAPVDRLCIERPDDSLDLATHSLTNPADATELRSAWPTAMTCGAQTGPVAAGGNERR